MAITQQELANIVVRLGIVEAIKQGFIQSGSTEVSSSDISDATDLGKSLLTATAQDALRGLIGVPMGQGVGDATDEASAVTQLNALLTQLRNSGIIQPSA